MNAITEKVFLMAAAVCCTASLAGCTDASAKLDNQKTKVFTVGDVKVTKGDMYSTMMTISGSDSVINDAEKKIAAKEIKVTDDMKKEAESTLSQYKTTYGDSFTSYLKEEGLSEDKYLKEQLIPSLQISELTKQYVKDNFKSLCNKYSPIKGTVLTFSSENDANDAAAALNKSAKVKDIISKYNSSSTGDAEVYTSESSLDASIADTLKTISADDGWQEVTGSDGSFNAVKLTSNDPDEFKDDAVDAIASITSVSDKAIVHYLKKYKFHVYDITVYNGIKNSNADYLVQNSTSSKKKSSASTASPAGTAEAVK